MSRNIPIVERRGAALSALAGAVLCAVALMASPAFAADEDTQASVYLVFDPETGEFVTKHDTQGTAKAMETQEAIESVADVGDAASGSGSAPAVTSDTTIAESPTSPTLIAGLVIVALAVIGGAVFLQRRA